MRKLLLFTNVSLDGYFERPGHDLSLFTNDFEAFSAGGSGEVDTLLFGRRTYEMMAGFWPTPQADAMIPEVAKFMNTTRKVVASRRGFEPGWQNVQVISGDATEEVRKLKSQPGGSLLTFGSNQLCTSLMEAGLIDEFRLVVNPVAFGAGTPLFAGLSQPARFTLTNTRQNRSGTVELTYIPTTL